MQGRRDSNPQPPDLESDALPIAPLPFGSAIHNFKKAKLVILATMTHLTNNVRMNYYEFHKVPC